MKGYGLPVLIVLSAQLGAAVLDHALRWGMLAAVLAAAYQVWRDNHLERRQDRMERPPPALLPPPERWSSNWPEEWRPQRGPHGSITPTRRDYR